MQRCLKMLGALCAFFILPLASAQNVIPGNTVRPTAPPPAAPAFNEANMTGGVLVSKDSKLNPGDEVSILIEEDREPAWKTYVTDTGDVELNALGSVNVAGRTATEAESVIGAYLRQRYYNKATVKFQILRKTGAAVRPFKVVVSGKVQHPGPQYFTATTPLKLSEAVIVAGTTIYSNIKAVQLTRGGRNSEINVQAITKEGRTDLDITLQNGDQIFVKEKSIVFGTN